jgi:hypothetical protein
MSTYPQYTLQSQDVFTFTINTLDTFPLHMPGVIESRELLRVLVFAAASRLSVHQTCNQLERAPSGATVLGTLASQFRDLDALEGHLNDLFPVPPTEQVITLQPMGHVLAAQAMDDVIAWCAREHIVTRRAH